MNNRMEVLPMKKVRLRFYTGLMRIFEFQKRQKEKGATVAAVYAPVTLSPALTKGSGLINAKLPPQCITVKGL